MNEQSCSGCAMESGNNPKGDEDLDWCGSCEPWRKSTPRKGGELIHEPSLTDDVAKDLVRLCMWLIPRLPEESADDGYMDGMDQVINNAFEFVFEVCEWRGINTLQFEEGWQLQRRLKKREALLERLLALKDEGEGVGTIIETQRKLVKKVADEIERRASEGPTLKIVREV